MQRIFLFLFLFLCLIKIDAFADYSYMPLSKLVSDADYCVIGSIVKLDQNYFWFRIEKKLWGNIDADTIPIMRFRDWMCGERYAAYEIGQKEIVFFKKSNYLIADFEYMGYGGGGEYELAYLSDSVGYNESYGHLVFFKTSEFISAISEYHSIVSPNIKSTDKPHFAEVNWNDFAKQSPAHKYLYKNNIEPTHQEKQSIEAHTHSTGDDATVRNAPDPAVCIGNQISDSLREIEVQFSRPKLLHYSDDGQIDNLIYTVLKFDMDLIHATITKTVKCKSEYGNLEFRDLLNTAKAGDKLRFYHIVALYPDGTIHQLPEKEVYIKKKF